MANKILIAGKSGTGKTYSLRNLPAAETFIICPDKKNPPFRGWRKKYISLDPNTGKFDPLVCNFLKTTVWKHIRSLLTFISENRPDIKYIVLDTITYAMIGEFMTKAKVTGFQKFTEMGDNVYQTLAMIDGLRDDITVIVLCHTDVSTFNGVDSTQFGVPGGKLVKDVVKPAGMFTTVLETSVEKIGDEVKYYFMTQNNTTNMAKSPEGTFSSHKIDNDMLAVVKAIRAYEEGE